MNQDSKEQEPAPAEAEKTWEWEVIRNPSERLHLINDTIEERVMQGMARVVGFAELAGADNPFFAQKRQGNANSARDAANIVSQQLRAIQWVIRLDPQQPLPIDRTTYASTQKAIIVLDQVPDPDIQSNPLSKP